MRAGTAQSQRGSNESLLGSEESPAGHHWCEQALYRSRHQYQEQSTPGNRTIMPDSLVASSFVPTAIMYRPKTVRESTN